MLVETEKIQVTCPMDLVNVMKDVLSNVDETDAMKEHFWCIGLNGASVIQYVELVTLGLINQALVHPREVFRHAISESSVSIAVCHNHPSGIVEPSREDNDVTSRLKAAGEIVGIQLIDHVIITDSAYYSYAEHDAL